VRASEPVSVDGDEQAPRKAMASVPRMPALCTTIASIGYADVTEVPSRETAARRARVGRMTVAGVSAAWSHRPLRICRLRFVAQSSTR
jgi:hypothetical protein